MDSTRAGIEVTGVSATRAPRPGNWIAQISMAGSIDDCQGM